MSKDLYIAVFDELYQEFIDAGETEEQAMLKAEMLAYDKYADRLADMADYARLIHKEQQ